MSSEETEDPYDNTSALGNSTLGSSKLGTTTETPGPLITDRRTPRERFDSLVKSAFPTDSGTTWDSFLNTLAAEFETELSVRQNLWLQQYIDHATDAQLDKIGAYFNLSRRSGERDAHYRSRIKLQIPKYTSGATINEILDLSSVLLGCRPQDLELIESFDIEPARFDIQVKEQVMRDADVSVEEYEALLQDVKAAGVRARATIGKQFTYRSIYDWENNINDESRGYGGLNTDVGGAYADLITSQF